MNLASTVSREWRNRLSRASPPLPEPSERVVAQIPDVVGELVRWLGTPSAEPDAGLRKAFRELTRRMRAEGVPTTQALQSLTVLEQVLTDSDLVNSPDSSLADADRVRLGLRGMLLDAVRVNTEMDARLSRERADALEFFGEVLTHEIGNRLGAAQTAAQLLRSPGLEMEDDRKDDLLRLIGEGVDEALKTVDDVTTLMVSHSRLEREDLPVGRVVEQVARTLKPIARRDAVRLRVEVDDAGGVSVDAARMRLILTNLVMNGIRYRDREREGSFVRMAAAVDGAELVVAVEDNGLGIPEAERERVFHYRERGTGSAGGGGAGGSGLGLAVVAEAAGQMGAALELESEVGRGSTFRLRIPLEDQARD